MPRGLAVVPLRHEDRKNVSNAGLEVVVHDRVVEVIDGFELPPGQLEAALDLLGCIRPATRETGAEHLEGGR